MPFDPSQPYNDLPPLPPTEDIETPAILRKAITAGRALAELKGLGDAIPNQSMLVNSLVLQEAKSSSEVENIITTDDALYQAFAAQTENIDPATKEVLRYRHALWEGYKQLKNRKVLTTNLFISVVQEIKANTAGIRTTPGAKIKNVATGEVLYTPPEGEQIIRDKLANLESYIHNENGTDPLIKMSVIHYQFESIHPFSDGNGRTGRIINILYLVQKGLIDLPVLYLSKYITQNKRDYYRLLRDVTAGSQWEPWIAYMLDAVEKTALMTRDRILQIRELMNETIEMAKRDLPRRVYSKELIEALFSQPYTKGQVLIDAGIAKRQTVAEYLKELEKIGILTMHKSGKENLYLNVRLYELLSR